MRYFPLKMHAEEILWKQRTRAWLMSKKNITYYMKKFRSFYFSGGLVGFNWCAFILGPYWFLYRKMYVIGLLFLLINILLGGLSTYAFISFLLSLIYALFGDYLYMRHIDKKVEKAMRYPPFMRLSALFYSGGTNLGIPLAAYAGLSLFSYILSMMQHLIIRI